MILVPIFAFLFLGLLLAIVLFMYQLSNRHKKSNDLMKDFSDNLFDSKAWEEVNKENGSAEDAEDVAAETS